MTIDVGEKIATSRQFEKDVSMLMSVLDRRWRKHSLTCIPHLLHNETLGLGWAGVT